MAAKLQCEICGGKLIGKPGGIFECDSCGMEYDTAWAKQKIQEITGTVTVEGTVNVQGTVKIENPVTIDDTGKITNLLSLGEGALNNMKWDDASKYYDRVLEIDSTNAEAYLGRFLANCRRPNLDRVRYVDTYMMQLFGHDYQKSKEYATGKVQELISAFETRVERERKEKEQKAADQEAQEQQKKQRFIDYQKYLQEARSGNRAMLEKAIEFFAANSDYALSREAERLCRERLPSSDICHDLETKIQNCRDELALRQQDLTRYNKQLLELGFFGARDQKTLLRDQISRGKNLCADLESKIAKYNEELSAMHDVASINRDLHALLLQSQIEQLKSGSKVELGSYYEDHAKDKAPIIWSPCHKITNKNFTRVTLISDQILDVRTKGSVSGKWDHSGIQQWLQNTFKNEAFSATEQKLIEDIRLPRSSEVSSFITSLDSSRGYLKINRQASPTKYAAKHGAKQGIWVTTYDGRECDFSAVDAQGEDILLSKMQESVVGVRPVIEISFDAE